MEKDKKKAARKDRRQFQGMTESDKKAYRELADKSYQGKISPVSKV